MHFNTWKRKCSQWNNAIGIKNNVKCSWSFMVEHIIVFYLLSTVFNASDKTKLIISYWLMQYCGNALVTCLICTHSIDILHFLYLIGLVAGQLIIYIHPLIFWLNPVKCLLTDSSILQTALATKIINVK